MSGQRRMRKKIPNQELNELANDPSKGNSNAAMYHKADSINFYYIISMIIRCGMSADFGIPLSDEVLVGENGFEIISSPDGKGGVGMDIYDPKYIKENNLSKLYSLSPSSSSKCSNPSSPNSSSKNATDDDFVNEEDENYKEEVEEDEDAHDY